MRRYPTPFLSYTYRVVPLLAESAIKRPHKFAKWSVGAYLLNEAGKVQANFSNSLLLFSERGGFVIPDAPTGIAIATALKVDATWQGPLITSLSVDVGQGGVKTTVKMDLYTAQFGKLQKVPRRIIGLNLYY